jgi:peptide/nickel transport system permease protein
VLGTVLGLVSGYGEGTLDYLIQRGVDTTMAIPGIVLALAVMSVLGQSLTNIILVIAFVIAPGASRVVRGTVLVVKQHTFVDAAQALGASPGRIVARHVLPNVFAPILVIATVWLGNAIVIEAALSFLGLGTPPPTPTWGAMLSGEGRRNLETAPYLAIFPGVAISIVVLAFNMLGDALRDLLDPRLRRPLATISPPAMSLTRERFASDREGKPAGCRIAGHSGSGRRFPVQRRTRAFSNCAPTRRVARARRLLHTIVPMANPAR